MATRVRYAFPVEMRSQLEATIRQCAGENGGRAVGAPSIEKSGKILEVDEHPWWDQHMKVVYPQLTLLAVNYIANPKRDDPPRDGKSDEGL